MSDPAEIASRIERCAVAVCWSQWSTLAGEGVPAGQTPVRSIIDPEALVLMSLALRHAERRLDQRLLWWARLGSSLMSLQRMRTLLAAHFEAVRGEAEWFAAQVVAAGDRRWSALAQDHPGTDAPRRRKGPTELHLLMPSTLMLRLRAGFGVGAKADLLAFLLGMAPIARGEAVGASVPVIAKAISYSLPSVRRAAGDMTLARLLDASADRPTQYSLEVAPWRELLRLRDPYRAPLEVRDAAPELDSRDLPPWRFWAQMFAFAAACLEWNAVWGRPSIAPVVRASHARDIAEAHRAVLVRNGIPWTDPRTRPGEQYLAVFHRLVGDVAGWMEGEG